MRERSLSSIENPALLRLAASPIHQAEVIVEHSPTTTAPDDIPLLRLPEELLLHILAPLDLVSLHSCKASCRSLSRLISGSAVTQYAELTQYLGVLDNPLPPTVVADRLEQLRRLEAGWRQFTFSAAKRVAFKSLSSGIYDLTGGFYFLGSTDGQPTPTRSRGATKAINWFNLTDVTEAKDPNTELRWATASVGEDIIDVGIKAEEHDLISIVSTSMNYEGPRPVRRISLHFVKMSTGQPHPAARHPVMKVSEGVDSDSGRPAVMLEIVGDVLALFLTWHGTNAPTDMFYIIDWKNGCITMERPLEAACYASFVFLSEDVIAVPRQKPFAIELYKLPSTWNVPPLPGSDPAALDVTRTLLLPSPARSVWVTHFSCRAEPNPSAKGSRPFGRGRTDSFSPDPAEAVVVFHILVRRILMPFVWGEGGSLSFITHRATLLALLEDEKPAPAPAGFDNDLSAALHEGSSDVDGDMPELASISSASSEYWNSMGGRVLAWRKWGPRATRWFPTDDVPTAWITVSCGARFIVASTDEDAPTEVSLYDFGRNRVKRAVRAVQQATAAAERTAGAMEEVTDRVGAWVQETTGGGHALAEPGMPPSMPSGWGAPASEPAFTIEDDGDEVWEDDSDDYLRAGGWASEEWSLGADDRVLRRCGDARPLGEVRLVCGELPLPPALGQFFEGDVVSGLPYVAVTRELERKYAGVLVEEGHLVGLLLEEDGSVQELDVIKIG